MTEELKPCQNCGSPDIEKEFYQGPQPLAVCKDCGHSRFLCDWNTRPLEDALQQQINELYDELASKLKKIEDRDREYLALRAELARKDELIKRQNTLVELYDSWSPLGHTTDWANKFAAARAAVDEIRKEKI